MKTGQVAGKILGWFIGSFLFVGLNISLFIKKFFGKDIYNAAFSDRKLRKLKNAVELSIVRGEKTDVWLYKLPEDIPSEVDWALISVAVKVPSAETEELSLRIISDERCYDFFLFMNPFKFEPELNYSEEEVLISIPQNGTVKIILTGRLGEMKFKALTVKLLGFY